MRVQLAKSERPDAPKCPDHGFPMILEDWDSAYKQEWWLCPVTDCGKTVFRGPTDNDIYLREQGRL